jgi:hypothetical protein
LINIAIWERRLTGGSNGDESILRGRRDTPEEDEHREISPIRNCDLCNPSRAEKATADDSANRRRSVAVSGLAVVNDHVGRDVAG